MKALVTCCALLSSSLCGGTAVLTAGESGAPDPFAGVPYRLRHARTGRVSSWDRTGDNQDFISFRPGETKGLLSLDGPGALTHLYMTPAAPPAFLRTAVLRIFWDDESSPSVEVPFGDFFCAGECSPRLFTSHYVVVNHGSGSIAYNAYFPMPFRKRAPAIPDLVEAELLIEKARQSGGSMVVVRPGPPFSRGEVTLFRGSKAGDSVAFRVPVPQAGRVQIAGRFARALDLGQYRLLVDGSPLGRSVGFYNGQGGSGATHVIPTDERHFGTLELAAGEHESRFACAGKNGESAGHFLAADGFSLKLTP